METEILKWEGQTDVDPGREKILVLDIETAEWTKSDSFRDYMFNTMGDKRLKDPIKILENQEKVADKFALDPRTGKIIMIGYLANWQSIGDFKDLGDNIYEFLDFSKDEKLILERFWMILADAYLKSATIVTKNGKVFDIPFIYKRALIRNILPNACVHPYQSLIYPYSIKPHFDLSLFLDKGRLSEWAYLLNEADTFFPDGANIPGWFKKDQHELIIQKNRLDLGQTFRIYNKIKRYL